VHGALKRNQSRFKDGKTLEMSLFGWMGSLGLRCIYEVDGWTQPFIAKKVLCMFVELCTLIGGSSCKDLVAWESEGPRHQT
jgi:hypothetical protein